MNCCKYALGIMWFAWMPCMAYGQAPIDCRFQSKPTYNPWGYMWAVVPDATKNPVEATSVVYRVSSLGSDDITSTAETDAIRRVFATWMSVGCEGVCTTANCVTDCATADCDGGSVSAKTLAAKPNVLVAQGADYDGADGGDTSTPTTTTVQNIVYWVESGWGNSQLFAAGTLAVTASGHTPTSYFLVHSDIAFNGQDYKWRAYPGATAALRGNAPDGCSGGNLCYDVETVALHEVGHFFGFNHVSCTDAIMVPTVQPLSTRWALSHNEKAGLCAVYAPRKKNAALTCTNGTGSSCRAFGEECTLDNQCAFEQGQTARCWRDSVWPDVGRCTVTCTGHNDCPKAYQCSASSLCIPGPNFTGAPQTLGGGGTQQTPVALNDRCAPCNEGSQCQTGMCVGDGSASGNGFCTEGCLAGQNASCGTGFSCAIVGGGWHACVPNSGQCDGVASIGKKLNESCYIEDTSNKENSWYQPCGSDLICFGFKPQCAGQQGECVTHCNPTNRLCAQGLTCCYGVDPTGACISTPSTEVLDGGCFDLRREGETCAVGEENICDDGLTCMQFSQSNAPERCYSKCDTGVCDPGKVCRKFTFTTAACPGSVQVCCTEEQFNQTGLCEPGKPTYVAGIGVACLVNEDCGSKFCLKLDGQAACSRSCRLGTANGCPAPNTDVNGDGIGDGTFTCRNVLGGGQCWPDQGPIANLGAVEQETTPGGCCNAMSAKPGDVLVNLLVWLPMVLRLRRRRR